MLELFAAHGRQARGERGAFCVSSSACASSGTHADPEGEPVVHFLHHASSCVFHVLHAGEFAVVNLSTTLGQGVIRLS